MATGSEARDQRQSAERPQRIAEIRRSLELLHEPGDVFEIRALHVGRVKTVSGYFDDLDQAAEACWQVDQRKSVGVYATLNPCNPALLARASNRMVDWPKATTTDTEITRRRWLFIDLDPHRPAGIAATDDERQTARDLAAEIEDQLRSRGWPYPLIVDSGNGCYLLYRVDLPNDAQTAEVFKSFYHGLNCILPGIGAEPYADVDTTVFNASRILRVGGTTNRKGDSTSDRPHRPSVYNEPEADCPVSIVPFELIREVAGHAPKTKTAGTTKPRSTSGGNGRLHVSRLDVPRYLQARGVTFKTKEVSDGTAYLVQCPFDTNHGRNGETAIYQAGSGLQTFECKHNSCSGRRWSDFREAIGPPDPDHYDPPLHSQHGQTKQPAAEAGRQQPPAQPPAPPRFTQLLDSRALLNLDLRPQFLVKGVLVAGQPGVIGGRSKSLKTSVATDLIISLASGTPFLGKFETARSRVIFWSGESGAATIRETAKRVARAKQIDLADCSAWWSFDLPGLAYADHIAYLADIIVEKSADVCIVDPLYLSLLTMETAGQAGNLFMMGAMLQPLGELAQATGATFIVLHHFRKTGQPDPEEPAALEELSQSGVAEWARQWILLQRRQPYQGDGLHKLWLRAGGSFGHAGLYAVDIDEGLLDPETFEGRHWDVTVRTTTDAKEEARREREVQKAREMEEREQEHRQRLLTVIKNYPNGETARTLRTVARLNNDNFQRAITVLEGDRMVESVTVEKGGKTHDGYKLRT